ncbi:RelE Cytotoxic translational repressor of toxin-antitoxin stability system [Candidatus Nanopelagicaceae bacterium]
MGAYELHFHNDALVEWQRLDSGMRERLKKKLIKRLENPEVDSARLSGELSGLYVIRSQADGLRLIYRVDTKEKILTVASVGKREDLIAYRNAISRIE